MAGEDLGRKFPTPDVEFGLGGQLSLDQNSYVEVHRAPRAETFVKFEANLDASSPLPAGSSVLIDWYLNGVVVPSARVTILAGASYGFTTYTMALSAGDTLRPQLAQVGASVPGSTATFAARGSL